MKRRILQFLGFVSIIVGGALAALLVHGLFVRGMTAGWMIGDDVLIGAFALYLTYLGIRGINYGKAMVWSSSQFGWGRMLLGLVMIFVNLRNYFDPAPNLLKPSNASQAAGMNFAIILLSAIGLYLIVSGIRAGLVRNHSDGQNSAVTTDVVTRADHS